jgi:hypothetical protein
MKRLLILAVLCLSLFCVAGCVDIDEALPHYGTTQQK